MRRYLWAVCLCAGLGGCEHPTVAFDPPHAQSKVQDVVDWDDLANRVAHRFAVQLCDAPWNAPVTAASAGYTLDGDKIAGSKCRPFFIADMDNSEFSSVFKPLIEKHLINHNYIVSSTPEGAYTVQVEAKTFLYDPRGRYKMPIEYATFWAGAGALGWGLSTISSADTAIAAGAGSALLADILFAMNARTNAEVIVMTTLSDQHQVYYRGNEQFYVHPSDLERYWKSGPGLPVATLPVRTPPRQLPRGTAL